MHLHDSIFFNASFDDWRAINGPKIDAAWNLHHLLPGLDSFVTLGSVANTFGNVGQSIYSGTSSFLDAFARWRTRQGLPTVSIGLPVVDDVGYVTEREGMREKLSERMGSLSIKQVHTMIGGAIIGASSGLNPDSRALAFVPPSNSDNIRGLKDGALYLSIFRQKKRRGKGTIVRNGQDGGMSGEESLLDALTSKISSITMINREDVTPTRSLAEYGLDSLVSVELRNWIKRQYSVDLALTQIIGAANLQALADQISDRQKA
jgi:acyl carrier protein